MSPRYAVLLLLVSLTCAGFAQDKQKPEAPTNRLAKESSPYLLHHAHNPVDWFPWGDEAFAKAKKDGKLIFLSSGYSSCHWCHVMERESFSDKDVAALLNEHFVCIKLDREERPEVDHLYLTALQTMGNGGGWPMSIFLTAEGKPIAGGTYWPREDRDVDGETIPGFKTILNNVIRAWKDEPENITKTADLRAAQTRQLLSLTPRLALQPVVLDRKLVLAAVHQLESTFDSKYGGFGMPPNFRGPKFPRPPLLQLLQQDLKREKSGTVDQVVSTTLETMAFGGIYDHLGGGFHRYSTERTWTVPHFEKMLYDNAQLLEVYARAFREREHPFYRRTIVQTLAFVDREMTSPDGAFYTAIDADSSGEEGRFYVWTDDELAQALPDPQDLAFARASYGLDGPAALDGKYHVLVRKEVAARDFPRLDQIRQRLFEARDKRPRPSVDTKVLTSWNGEMIAGMALAGQAVGDAATVQRAVRAAEFLLKTVRTKDGRLFHAYAAVPGEPAKARIDGYLDDYTHLVHGLLTLHDVTNDARWLAEARSLTDTMIALFGDGKGGGFFYTTKEHEPLFARIKDQHDGVQPCGNSQAALNLVRLWRKTGDDKYRKLAEETLRTFAPAMNEDPRSLCTMTEALAELLEKP